MAARVRITFDNNDRTTVYFHPAGLKYPNMTGSSG